MIVYGFNPLTPLDLLPMPNISMFMHKEAQAKADYVKKLHEQVRGQIEKKMKSMQDKLTKVERRLSSNLEIGFGCT